MTAELPLILLFPMRPVSAGDRERFAAGEYSVRGHFLELAPPLDWGMDPLDNLSWRFWLHTMQFLDGPLRVYEEDGDLEALTSARDLVLDWIEGNRAGSKRAGDYAWIDMSAGVRASFLGYVWRECRRHELLGAEQEEAMTASLREHATWLLTEENYTPATNHGLYEDAGLFLLANYAAELEEAAGWREAVERRFLATLGRHVDFGEGLHKEHSPGYQMFIRELVKRLHEQAGIGGEDLAALIPKLDAAAGWLVLPDGRQLPFGDTDLVEAPAFARAQADEQGMAAFLRTGYAVVREGGSYLAMTGCYHTYAHKHADELSWCLYENEHLIVADPCRFSYHDESDPARVYARSNWGHNVLVADGESVRWIDQQPYGSALRASGEGEGWYAISGTNPLLTDLRHERLILYRPGEIVVVVDRVAAGEERQITRRLQLGDGLETVEAASGVEVLVGGEHLATVFLADGVETELSIASGVEEPEMDGWIFPREKERRPAPALTMRSRLADGVLVHGVAVAPTDGAVAVSVGEDGTVVVSPSAEAAFPAVRVSESGDDLELTPA